ncbi:hypothetical protein [Pseudonocardia adelaidensis]|uniref:Uncharacterized protein n=1 Tax=Pseudonocardia adelaidensis TaxID=648754 RepID=A0ABP9NCE6_9PSEU
MYDEVRRSGQDVRPDVAAVIATGTRALIAEVNLLPVEVAGRPLPAADHVEIDGGPRGPRWTRAPEVDEALLRSVER